MREEDDRRAEQKLNLGPGRAGAADDMSLEEGMGGSGCRMGCACSVGSGFMARQGRNGKTRRKRCEKWERRVSGGQTRQ